LGRIGICTRQGASMTFADAIHLARLYSDATGTLFDVENGHVWIFTDKWEQIF
jgi:hypothetical protein